jgi:hypothetical protein
MDKILDKLTTPFRNPITIDYWAHITTDKNVSIEDWVTKHKDQNDPWDICPTHEISRLKVYGVRINNEKVEAYASPIRKDNGKILEDRKEWFSLSEKRIGQLYNLMTSN